MKQGMDRELSAVLRTQRLAVLSTRGEGYPYPSLVAFAVGEDDRELCFTTKRETQKFDNLSRDPRVSLLVTDAADRADDIGEATAVTALGEAFELTSDGESRLRDFFLEKFPALRGFVEDPSSAFIRVAVHKFVIVTEFQKVREIVFEGEP